MAGAYACKGGSLKSKQSCESVGKERRRECSDEAQLCWNLRHSFCFDCCGIIIHSCCPPRVVPSSHTSRMQEHGQNDKVGDKSVDSGRFVVLFRHTGPLALVDYRIKATLSPLSSKSKTFQILAFYKLNNTIHNFLIWIDIYCLHDTKRWTNPIHRTSPDGTCV